MNICNVEGPVVAGVQLDGRDTCAPSSSILNRVGVTVMVPGVWAFGFVARVACMPSN